MTLEEMLTEYYKVHTEKDALEKREKSLKADILKELGTADEKTAGDYTAKVSQCSRSTLVAEIVEKKFNIKLTDDCYNKTVYPKLSVKPVKKED